MATVVDDAEGSGQKGPFVHEEFCRLKERDNCDFTAKNRSVLRYKPIIASHNDTANNPPEGMIAVYTKYYEESNFRLPPTPFLISVLRYYEIGFPQLHPFGLQKICTFEMYCRACGKKPSLDLFRYHFTMSPSCGSWFTLGIRTGSGFTGLKKTSLKDWRDRFFFVDKVAAFEKDDWDVLQWVDSAKWASEKGSEKNALPDLYQGDGFVDGCDKAGVHMRPYPEAILYALGLCRWWPLKNRVPVLAQDDKVMDFPELLVKKPLKGVHVGHADPTKDAEGKDSPPKAGDNLPESYVKIQSLSEPATKKKPGGQGPEKKKRNRAAVKNRLVDTSELVGSDDGDEDEVGNDDGDDDEVRNVYGKKSKAAASEPECAAGHLRSEGSNTLGPDPLGGFKYLRSRDDGSSQAEMFVPSWNVRVDSVARDLSSVKDFCVNVMPPAVKERLAKMSTGESICRMWKSTYDQLMYHTDSLMRMEQLFKINKEFDNLVQEQRAKIKSFEAGDVLEAEKKKVIELTEELKAVKEECRVAREARQVDSEKMVELEKKVSEGEGMKKEVEGRLKELEGALQVAIAERNDAVVAKRELQKGIEVISTKILKCPGIKTPFFNFAKALKDHSEHEVAMVVLEVIGELPPELSTFVDPGASARLGVAREELRTASSPYVQKLVNSLDLSVEQLLAIEP